MPHLRSRQLRLELSAGLGETQAPKAPVVVVGSDTNELVAEQLAQGTVQCLFRDSKRIEQRRYRHLRITAHEIQNSMMNSPKPVFGQDVIRLRGEGAIRKVKQLDGFTKRLDRKSVV